MLKTCKRKWWKALILSYILVRDFEMRLLLDLHKIQAQCVEYTANTCMKTLAYIDAKVSKYPYKSPSNPQFGFQSRFPIIAPVCAIVKRGLSLLTCVYQLKGSNNIYIYIYEQWLTNEKKLC